MEEIKIIVRGLNEEKLFITTFLSTVKDYTSYEKEKVSDLMERRDVIDGKIDLIIQTLLPKETTISINPKP